MLVESGKQDNLGAMTLPRPMPIDFENHKEIIENHEYMLYDYIIYVGASVIPTPGVLEWSARESRQPLHKGDFVYNFETLDRLPTGSVVKMFTTGGVRSHMVTGALLLGGLTLVGLLPLWGLVVWSDWCEQNELARFRQQQEADSLAKQRRNTENGGGGGGGQKTDGPESTNDTEGSDE